MIKHKDKKFFKKNGFFLFKNFLKGVLKARQWMLKQQPKKILKHGLKLSQEKLLFILY